VGRMSRQRRLPVALALCALLLASAGASARADADDHDGHWHNQRQASERERARERVVRPRTARLLTKARTLLLAQKYDDAKEVLAHLYPWRLHPYGRALLYRMQGYVAYGQNDPAAAVADFQKALDQNILSPSDVSRVLFQIAQIHASQHEWPQAVESLKDWLASSENPGSAGYFLLALAYYQMKDLDSALGPAQKAVDLADTPQQSWLQLLLAIQLTKKDYPDATPVAVELLTRYPQAGKSYWLQLSSLYGVQHDIARALAVLELANRLGYLTDDGDLLRLARLSQAQGMPLRAAKVLEDGLATQRIRPDVGAYELLGNSWILARESRKGEPALEQAARLSPQGNLYVRLAQVRLQNEEWSQAADALKQAVSKGGLDHPGAAQLLLGIACYEADHMHQARAAFVRARGTGNQRASAQAWLDHIDHELGTGRAQKVSRG
jgi:tetratricopeptide (TPR) repeat protein